MNGARLFVLTLAFLPLTLQPITEAAETAPLQPWTENAWYWQYHGAPVLLLGGSDDDNLFQWNEQDLVKQLDRLAAAGGNVSSATP